MLPVPPKMFIFTTIFILTFINTTVGFACYNYSETLNFTELATKYGQNSEEYKTVTEDGYILKIFRIPGLGKPVLLTHGIFDSSDVFIERGPRSLAVILAEQGYDVWLANVRGNKYSRGHVKLNPDVDKVFWDFSFHEHGFYDMPATIDLVLRVTGRDKVDIVGHSQGTTVYFVLGSTRPSYNAKIGVLIGLAPICFLNNVSPFLTAVVPFAPLANRVLKLFQKEELFGLHSLERAVVDKVCRDPILGYPVCLNLLNFPLTGFDSAELEPSFLPTYYGHFPIGSSRKNVFHFAQIIISGLFAQYDYGVAKNLLKYKSISRPKYDLTKVSFKVILMVGKNDGFSSIPDAMELKSYLPNVGGFYILQPPKFNHIDFVLGSSTYKVLYPSVLKMLEDFSPSDNVIEDNELIK